MEKKQLSLQEYDTEQPTHDLPQVHIYAAVSCNHTIDSMFNQSITCNYQYIVLGNQLMLFHVIYFKYGCSRQLLKDCTNSNRVQYRLNMKGEVERIYESLSCPVLCSAAQLQPASSTVVGVLLDSMLMQNLKLLFSNCTHALLNKSPKLYLENAVHVNGTSALFLFNNMIKVEKNFTVALKAFIKNINNLIKQFLFVKKSTGSSSSSSSSANAKNANNSAVIKSAVYPCHVTNSCKFKQMRTKFESYDHTSVHAALCTADATLVGKFSNLEYLILLNETRTVFEEVRNVLHVLD
ncbi:hypothetical protein Hz2V050 [Helicoverpa zea nudivirus 2]|uniref:Uncharacterized protein n=1 Tax=Helicoverpa zea nudivirus 2 TaxID=1128424 RepID=G9I076_HZNV2|nr:orf50 gene product [Helicoverpa zea nudivirus 2]AEW69599.1 hypothetical protein Hz2V050 [Helicoverpa zea nudivirus 2]